METAKIVVLASVIAFCAGVIGVIVGNHLTAPAPTVAKPAPVPVPAAPKPAQKVKKVAPTRVIVPNRAKKRPFRHHNNG